MIQRLTGSGWEPVPGITSLGPVVEGAPMSGYQVTLGEGDVDLHGAGYPVTYRFTVPAESTGLEGQVWDEQGQTWATVTPAPTSGRFDGIEAFRVAGTSAYLSAAFPANREVLYLRVVDDTNAEVGTFAATEPLYDARSVALLLTYDDTRTAIPEAAAAHQTAGIWMSPAINAGWLDTATGANELSTAAFAAAVAGGCVEPANHTLTHMSAGDYSGDQATADAQITGGRDGILAACDMPWQSRGRVHGFVYPNGTAVAETFEGMRRASHIIGRSATVTGYRAEPWDADKGFYVQPATIGGFSWTGPASAIVDAVNASRTAALHRYVHVYTYVHNWDWTPGAQMPAALNELGAMADVWSVGLGHHALYRRTRERATVVAL